MADVPLSARQRVEVSDLQREENYQGCPRLGLLTMTARPLSIFTLSATAASGCNFPAGEKHALLAAAVDIDDVEAGNRIEAALAEHGWTTPVWSRSGRVDNPEAAPEGSLRDTATAALRDGCALIAYADPIE